MTQHEKILALMRAYPDKEWWRASDFQKPDLPGHLFVGYEATARISELSKMSPRVVDVEREGRFRLIRLHREEEKPRSLPVPEKVQHNNNRLFPNTPSSNAYRDH